MERETKQTLISLSLAGAIGYYLYKKLSQADGGLALGYQPSTKEKTEQDLMWTPEPEKLEYETPTISDISEENPIISEEETAVLFEEQTFEPMQAEEVIEQDQLFEEPVMIQEENVEELVVEPTITNEEESEQIFVEQEKEIELEDTMLGDDFGIQLEEVQQTEELLTAPDNISDDFEELKLDEQPLEFVEEEQKEVAPELLDMEGLNLEELTLPEPISTQETDVVVEEQPIVEETPIIPAILQPTATVQTEESELDAIKKELNLDSIDEQPQIVDSKDKTIDELFNGEQKIMENVEPLHKIDQNDESSKKEFESILDFFSTL